MSLVSSQEFVKRGQSGVNTVTAKADPETILLHGYEIGTIQRSGQQQNARFLK